MTAKSLFRQPSVLRSGITALAVAGALLGLADAWAGTVRLTWTAPGDDGTTGQAASYDLRYSLAPVSGTDTTSWWNGATPVGSLSRPKVAGSSEAFTVAGLDSGMTYYFIIRTADEVPNVSAFSNISVRVAQGSTFYTLATPQGFRAQATPTSITLIWKASPSDAGTEYHMYRTGPGDTSPQLLQILPLATTSWTDSTVSAGLSYEYRLATYGGGQEGTPAILQVTAASEAGPGVDVVQAYPNPARDHVTLRFTIGGSGSTSARSRIALFDLTGHRIRELLNEVLPPGEHTLTWNCLSSTGERVAPGVYSAILDGPSGRVVAQLAILP